jgi:SAM-dependent methyltransferase
VTGIDVSGQMIAVVRRRFPAADLRVGTAEALPFADGELRAYRAERLYQHLADPISALAEARRTLAPGGRLVLVDQDCDTLAIDSDDVALDQALLHAFADSVANGRVGRRYRALLLDAGFADVAVEVHTMVITDHALAAPGLAAIADAGAGAGVATGEQVDAWLAALASRAERDRFLQTMPLFVASAHRP